MEEEIIMTYKRLLDAENDFKLRLSIAQKLHYSEVRKFIEKMARRSLRWWSGKEFMKSMKACIQNSIRTSWIT